MSDRQLCLLFQIERTEEGYPKIVLPSYEPPSARAMFGRRCFLLGINEPSLVEKLWNERG